ncbi:MAG TPA: protein kinase [Kofleriaceae bacterium]|nr:protein kinase [Kofleriaceae bacterium]
MSGGSADLGRAAPAGAGPGAQLGGFTLGQPLWKIAVGDVYRATAQGLNATVVVVRPELAAIPTARDAIVAAAKAAAQLPEHRHLVRTLGGGVENGVLWVALEEVDGSLVRDLLARKREAGGGGFGARGAGNLVVGVAGALHAAGHPHGAIGAESVIVNRTGRVRVLDLALGPGVAAAIKAGRLQTPAHVAPELASSAIAETADVYGLGALLYEVLVGRPLQKGGPRPSEAVVGLTSQIDELIARMCARDPGKRFGSIEVVKELISEALGRGGAIDDATPPPGQSSPSLAAASQPSLAQALSNPSITVPAASDPALAAALADTTEKWLIQKGRLDYGPFSLADVLQQIKSHQIVAGNVMIDKDSGGRFNVEDHPILGPMVEDAKHAKDTLRRAEAEEDHHAREKTRGVVLYSVIGAGVLGLALGVFFLVKKLGSDEGKQATGVESVGNAKLDVKISMPKAPPKVAHSGGHHGHGGGGGGGGNGTDALSFDMSGDDDDDSGAPLDMQTVYNVYSKYGGGFAKCLGGGSASVAIIIDGKSGRVTFVKVNGGQSGEPYGCINRLMRSMQFPTTTAPRTRAEFDISL